MSDYTPSIDRLEAVYVTYTEMQRFDTRDKAEEQFKRAIAAAKAEAWDEAYRQGIEDERTAEALKVDIGLGGYATANRSNPYRKETE